MDQWCGCARCGGGGGEIDDGDGHELDLGEDARDVGASSAGSPYIRLALFPSLFPSVRGTSPAHADFLAREDSLAHGNSPVRVLASRTLCYARDRALFHGDRVRVDPRHVERQSANQPQAPLKGRPS